MPRKGSVGKRDVLPDPIYNSKLVTRLINKIMIDGKKGTAQTILYTAFKKIEAKTQKNAMDVFATALDHIMPEVELKAKRIGAANYQVPTEVSTERKVTLGLRWLVNYARLRKEKIPTKWLKLTKLMLTISGNHHFIRRDLCLESMI